MRTFNPQPKAQARTTSAIPEDYKHLVLSRKPGELVEISVAGVKVFVHLQELRGDKARLGFFAPADVVIVRSEIVDKYPTPAPAA